jgi:uncharacterized membrane protein YphA (DoxX/SURF4 family)
MTGTSTVAAPQQYTPDVQARPAAMSEPRWHPATLLAFRFCFVYFGLYVVLTQMLSALLLIPRLGFPPLGNLRPLRAPVFWAGAHVLGIARPFSEQLTGSGDKLFNWVQVFTIALAALVATAIWSAVARRRPNHERLYAGFRIFLRLALGTTMLTYGFIKVVPLQMPPPSLARLLEPFGNFSPMGVLWASIGASAAYEMVVGAAEVAGGLLVMIPQTTKIGAILCLVDTADVFALNMTYDVPVKLFALHLMLMSLVLIAYDARGLVNLFLLQRGGQLRPEPRVAKTAPAHRVAIGLQVAYAAYIASMLLWGGLRNSRQLNAAASRSPLYGIWDVQAMTIDGVEHPPLLTDPARWRRALFQTARGMSVQRMNDSLSPMLVTIDTTAHTMLVSSLPDTTKRTQTLTYARPEHERLVLDGALDGHVLHVELSYRDPAKFLLRTRGFSWVQERPFNR